MTKPTAVFIGYMGANLPLYNINDPDDTLGHDTTPQEAESYAALGMPIPARMHGPHCSTVSAKTLASLGIDIPPTPAWKGGK